MARIPVIEQTTNVSTSVPTSQAQGMQVVSPLGNAPQIAAGALSDMSSALIYKDNADAVANTGKMLSDFDVKQNQYLLDVSKSTVDGGMVKQEDGTLVPMRQKTQQDFDTEAATFMKGITNEKAKIYAQNHINSLRTRTLDAAQRFEASAGISNRSAKVDEAVNTWSGTAASNSGLMDELIESAKIMIANSGFDEKTRNDKAVAATKQIIEAAATGEMNRDPVGFKAAALKRYGIDPTAPKTAAPATAQPDGSLPASGSVMSQAIGFTMQHEGGLNAKDTNGTASNMGINQASHPGIDVTKLTKAQAADIYQKEYWQGINGDALAAKSPALAIAAMDTAALAGVGKAKQLIAQSGGDANKFMDLRENFLNGLLKSNPEKYGPYAKAWGARNADLRTSTAAGSGRGLINPPAAVPTAGEPVEVAAPIAPPINPATQALVDRLPDDRLGAYIAHANTLVNQQQATVRASVTTTEGDQVTAFMNGQTVVKPLTQAEYTAAFGPVEGPSRFANFQQIQQLGNDMTSMKAMPPAQMQQLAENYKPDPNKPGYELATKRYETLLRASDQINTARQSDAMAYAMQNGIGGAQPLDFNDPKKFGAELNKRQGVASMMQSTYGTPYTMLTKAEVTTLSGGFEKMTTQQRLGYLETIKTSVADPAAYRSIMQQIAPDSPVTAMAGIILSKQDPMRIRNTFSADAIIYQKDVAGIMLEGEQLINPTKGAKGEDGKGKTFPMPKEQDMRDQFTNVVGKAFAADPRGADFAYQAVKAYYAGKSARVGDVTGATDSTRLKEAITAVIGGVSDTNGKGEVIRPWGMDEARFKNVTEDAFNKAMASAGYTGSSLDNFGAYGLQSAGDSKYMLRSGTGYVADRSGNPIVLDVTPSPTFHHLIPTGTSLAPASITPPPTVVPEKSGKPVMTQPKTK